VPPAVAGKAVAAAAGGEARAHLATGGEVIFLKAALLHQG
jgi:hypothetical protein